ncbi:phosphoribosylglycinamide formyltransferase [Flavobacterium silvaticum]|uniref:phosphoribosylglycinamide formyltransferase 1 n=1 Tax=Flavobacterium silvaticum TaxID=1852020 RepID=A0A972FTD1_9FLAO|nr:phosphoribosylglycinamide formyltransferase [Flavobacterium silvaticum]NMH27637.1 phosphoribosylglycinamide formyltransferase [Flavobacterium silvaticum]
MKKLLIFASGAGTNAANIMRFFKSDDKISVAAVFTNKPDAGVVDKAADYQIPVVTFTKQELLDGTVLDKMAQFNPDLIVLSGFLLHVPSVIVQAFPDKIVNIHPALLPKYGGHGMYGMNVHKAVLENNEPETGISIHYVNEQYDEGDVIFQRSTSVADCSSAEEIALLVQKLEHEYFPKVIREILLGK